MGPQQDRSSSMANGTAAARSKEAKVVHYRECQRNYAASIGGHAVDGCRSSWRPGAVGTAAALACAACRCHRSFHRREVEAGDDRDCSSTSTTSG
ncbi:unnamed protein product [Miscanthus lutarioriparius]|uniref:ZF-HD dimerization-type domain-containing protein n=1 Tax=Miscanthus lutarioriparius TaxID=422564 RepID=A0A811SRM1_9POAL|nr:unnamed protein product [Miscanthus lutarioriparius]